jgi:methyl-accepting chemotaxis protein
MQFFNEVSTRWFGNRSIGAKLYGMAGVLVGLLIMTAVMALMNLSSSARLGRFLYTDPTTSIEHLQAVGTYVGNTDTDLARAVGTPTGSKRYLHDFASDSTALEAALNTYYGSGLTVDERGPYQQLKTSWGQYQSIGTSVRRLIGSGRQAAARQLYFAKAAAINDDVDAALTRLVGINESQAARSSRDISANYSSSRTVTVIAMVLAALLGGGIAVLLARSIANRAKAMLSAADGIADGDVEQHVDATAMDELGQTSAAFGRMIEYLKAMVGAASRIAEGDLTVEVEPRSARDALGASFSAMIAKLRGMIGEMSTAADSVSSASQQMAATSEQSGRATGEIATAIGGIAEGAERQVQIVEAARHSAEEVARAVGATAQNAQQTAQAAHAAREAARQGVSAAEHATEAMRSVRDSSKEVSGAIKELAAKSDQIGAIVNTITGIAEQTNLLALNAAIEAARAGEQGRGFAVVAEEVRKLAEEAQHAAEEIAQLIGAIQADTGRAVEVVDDGAKRTEDGAAVVEQTREAFLRIGTSVDDMTGRIEQIAAASEQIAASAQSMQQSIGEVASVAQESSASTEEVSASTEESSAAAQEISASAQELSGNAEVLNNLVAQFKLAG